MHVAWSTTVQKVSVRLCVCVHPSHRDNVLSQYAAIFSVCATIQPRERCALKIMISL